MNRSLKAAALCSLMFLGTAAHAATVNCTIDGTTSPPRVTFGKPADCKVTGSNGQYQLLAKKEPKFVQATCWRDGGGGDAAQCTVGLVRSLPNKKTFHIGTHLYPGSGASGTRPAWFSFSYTY